jgi:hypothetical protein
MAGVLETSNGTGKKHRATHDARKRNRLKTSLPVQVQPFDARFAALVDVGQVTDFSRQGLYFVTCMPHYSDGMRLILTFPFSAKTCAHKKFLGTIVRIEERNDGNRGVAVQFLL